MRLARPHSLPVAVRPQTVRKSRTNQIAMFHAVLLKMRQRVCAGRMALTILMLASPAREETYHDDWLTEDLENGIL